MELEREYWQALMDRDTAAVQKLTDETCLLTGAQGVGSLSRDDLAHMMDAAEYELKGFRIEEPQVRMLGRNIAVLAYKVHEDLVVDGKDVQLDAADASTWVRRGDRWVCALHTESILGDPFGRDRAE